MLIQIELVVRKQEHSCWLPNIPKELLTSELS